MRSYLDAKLMAKTLREALAQKQIPLSHSETLEIVAQQFGFADWNILVAKINPSGAIDSNLPDGWKIWGNAAQCYDMGIDPTLLRNGQKSAVIHRNTEPFPSNNVRPPFGTLMQTFKADDWRNKKLELTAELKAQAADSVQMWVRIDGPIGLLQFDNMDYRAVKGTQDWTSARIVVPISNEAVTINFGFFVSGEGTGWASGFKINEVNANEPETTGMGYEGILSSPKNLDFAM
ncbi:glyoxalase superfamily protein [Deefgea rivuli]|uniref:glyoxalase superfamily protein n=1 Tax=Deefgea rivuli TaxID=400948 RepID=UPI000688E765|nr:glyoxalase superfamily protein [Deefgea rivuli]